MFAPGDVDALFSSTTLALRRSRLLLAERSRAAPPEPSPVLLPTPSFTAALVSLRRLTDLSAFLDASAEVAARLAAEAVSPSPALERRRRNGSGCPLFRRVVDGLAAAQSIWADGEWPDAAAVAAALLRAGLLADWQQSAAAAQTEPARRDGAAELLAKSRAMLPADAADELDALLVRAVCGGGGDAPLLRFSAALPYWVCRAPPSLVRAAAISPIAAQSAALSTRYRELGAAGFVVGGQSMVRHMAQQTARAGWATASASDARRAVTFAKELLDAALAPLELAFASTSAASRRGAAADFYHAIAQPMRAAAREAETEGSNLSKAMASVWCTACYRALVVVEALAKAEMGVLSGKGNEAAQQRRYESMLRQSNGKVTTALLATVTEDRQLLFEETTARSAQGHKVYRIHAGVAGVAAFVYLDDGTIFMKVGRERSYRRAKSVEEVFAAFAATAAS